MATSFMDCTRWSGALARQRRIRRRSSAGQEGLSSSRGEGRSWRILCIVSTAESADEVVVVDRGRVVQRGPHAELLRDPDGVYAGLYRSWVAQQGR